MIDSLCVQLLCVATSTNAPFCISQVFIFPILTFNMYHLFKSLKNFRQI